MRKSKLFRYLQGFTLIEILVVIGMIAILASVVLVAINPLRQFAQARNAQRASDVNAILNAVGERVAENRGLFTDTSSCTTALPQTATKIASAGGFDLRACIVPAFISEIPVDPSEGSNACSELNCTNPTYDTGYTIAQDSETNRIMVCAPAAAETAIPGSKPFCLTR